MNGSEVVVSAGALMRVLVFLLYAPVCLAVFRWPMPRLALSYRILAIALLAAQILILAVGLEDTPRWVLKGWLWHLDQEWNIPSAFASTQLAVVSGAALTTALLARAYSAHYRLFTGGIGVFFVILAWDEYFMLHETDLALETAYIASGMVIAAATVLAAARSPRRARSWHVCLLAGMALNVMGAMAVDALPQMCRRLGSIQLEGCLYLYNLEEAFEFLGVWLILVAILGSLSDGKAKLRRVALLFLLVLPICWIFLLVHDALLPRIELRFRARPAAVQFESGVTLLGYRVENNSNHLALWLYPSAWRSDYSELGFSLHLVDQESGASIAGRDIHSRRQGGLLLAPAYNHVYRQRITIETPGHIPTNRALWIALSIWRDADGEYVGQSALSSDHQLLSEKQVILGELVLPAAPTDSFVPLAVLDGRIALGDVELPVSARRGQALRIWFSWRADADVSEDYVQFLHLGHAESGEWWVYDQPPLGPRLPTRLWYSGLADSEVWEAPLPADLAPGVYAVYTGLYRQSDQERVPASDADGTPYPDARVPLGGISIEP